MSLLHNRQVYVYRPPRETYRCKSFVISAAVRHTSALFAAARILMADVHDCVRAERDYVCRLIEQSAAQRAAEDRNVEITNSERRAGGPPVPKPFVPPRRPGREGDEQALVPYQARAQTIQRGSRQTNSISSRSWPREGQQHRFGRRGRNEDGLIVRSTNSCT